MITQKTTIMTLLSFWSYAICQEEDTVGVPLLTQLHLAKAKAMHNLAIAKAKLHPSGHLLLESNPMYTHEDTLLTSANLNSDSLEDVQTHLDAHPTDYGLPKKNIFKNEDPMTIFNTGNKEIDQSAVKVNASPLELNIQSDVPKQATTEQQILLLEEPVANLPDSNLTIPRFDKINITEPSTIDERLQMIKSATGNPPSNLKDIENHINVGKYKSPSSQGVLPLDSDLPLFFDLKTLEQLSPSDGEINEVFDKSKNLKAIQGINEQNNNESSSKAKINSHVLPNGSMQPVGLLKKSNDDVEERNLKSIDSNSNVTSISDSQSVFGTLRNNDKSRYMNIEDIQHLSESARNSERFDSNLKTSLRSSAESSEETTTPKPPVKSRVDNLENINVSTTEKSNIITDSFETHPTSNAPENQTESNITENGDYRNQHKPKLNGKFLDKILDDDLDLLSLLAAPKPNIDPRNMGHTPSIIQNFGKVGDYTKMPMEVLLPIESTTEKVEGEINPMVEDEFHLKRKMYLDQASDLPNYVNMKERLLGKELRNSEVSSDHFEPTFVGNTNKEQYQPSRTLFQTNNYGQQNNRFGDGQLYLWENRRSTLDSPYTEDVLGNPPPQRFNHKQFEANAYGPNFHRLKQYIKQIHEQDLNKQFPRQNIQETIFQPRENENLIQNNQSHYPERVSAYLLHFPPNQPYVGERYRREVRNLKQKKSTEKGTRRQLPLISLIIDPYARLDVPKTIKNFGTVTKNSLEDKKAPMYYLNNMLASMRNAALATMMIPPQDLIIPADYKIINKKAIDNEIVGTSKFSGNSLEKGGVFHKVGSIMRQSIESGQEALQHVNDVAQNARRIVSSTRQSLPRLLVPYAKVPEVTKAKTKNKLTLITPRFADVGEDSTSHEDDYVKVGHVLDALSLSHPQQKDVGTMKITIQPKSKEPRLQSRFGDANEPEDPGYYVVKNHLEGNTLNPDEMHEIIEIFHTIKEVAGAKSLKDLLKNVRTQLENCTHNNSNIQFNSTSNEKVGTNLKFTKEMIEPFMGILRETSQEPRGKKFKRATSKRKYYDAENAAFANFLAGYEIVSSINPEVYRTYFHEPLNINHSADVNLKEIQHEIKNSKLLIPPPLLTSSKSESEEQNGTVSLNDGDEDKTGLN